jgi:hypothetical protein
MEESSKFLEVLSLSLVNQNQSRRKIHVYRARGKQPTRLALPILALTMFLFAHVSYWTQKEIDRQEEQLTIIDFPSSYSLRKHPVFAAGLLNAT